MLQQVEKSRLCGKGDLIEFKSPKNFINEVTNIVPSNGSAAAASESQPKSAAKTWEIKETKVETTPPQRWRLKEGSTAEKRARERLWSPKRLFEGCRLHHWRHTWGQVCHSGYCQARFDTFHSSNFMNAIPAEFGKRSSAKSELEWASRLKMNWREKSRIGVYLIS